MRIFVLFQNTVIIVGAGVMGLGTAFHLAQKGYDVTILEKGNSVANVSWTLHSNDVYSISMQKLITI